MPWVRHPYGGACASSAAACRIAAEAGPAGRVLRRFFSRLDCGFQRFGQFRQVWRAVGLHAGIRGGVWIFNIIMEKSKGRRRIFGGGIRIPSRRQIQPQIRILVSQKSIRVSWRRRKNPEFVCADALGLLHPRPGVCAGFCGGPSPLTDGVAAQACFTLVRAGATPQIRQVAHSKVLKCARLAVGFSECPGLHGARCFRRPQPLLRTSVCKINTTKF